MKKVEGVRESEKEKEGERGKEGETEYITRGRNGRKTGSVKGGGQGNGVRQARRGVVARAGQGDEESVRVDARWAVHVL